jgi:hypothetical protein
LLEEEHRRKLAGNGKGKKVEREREGGDGEEDDEEFKRAVEASLKQDGRLGEGFKWGGERSG